MKPELCVSSRKEWRSWLKKNHAVAAEIWLVYYKKQTGKPSISYMDSVKEALCFGWIDGIKKRIDEERYAHRFTPRGPKSKWSPQNVELAQIMIGEGKMSPAGLASFNQRLAYDDEFLETRAAKELIIPPEIEETLKLNEKAWRNFTHLAPGYKKQYVSWLMDAKRPETKERRLKAAIHLLTENKKLGMK